MNDVERVDREELNVSRREVMAGSSVVAGAAVAGVMPRKVAAQQDPDNEISGTVTDAQGAVDGATVVAVPHDSSLDPIVTTTDANGEYVFAEADLYTGDELYHVIARDGTEADPRRGQENYPFIAAEGGPAIPDSEGLHARYDWTQASGTSSVTDQTGNGHDLTGTYTGPTASINGNQAGEFDGSDDVLDVSFSTIDQPTTIAWVGRYDGTIGDGDQDVAFDQVGTNDAHQFFVDEGAGDTTAFAAAGLTGPPSTNDATVYVVIFDGSNSEVHVGNNSTSGDAGTGPMQDGLTVGADQSGGRNFEGAMVEMLVYPKNQSSIVGDIKSYLANQAGITL